MRRIDDIDDIDLDRMLRQGLRDEISAPAPKASLQRVRAGLFRKPRQAPIAMPRALRVPWPTFMMLFLIRSTSPSANYHMLG